MPVLHYQKSVLSTKPACVLSTQTPTGTSGSHYDPENLPIQIHEDYVQDVMTVEHTSGSSRKCEVQAWSKLLVLTIL